MFKKIGGYVINTDPVDGQDRVDFTVFGLRLC
jgi:fructose-1,6-bisphosphatase